MIFLGIIDVSQKSIILALLGRHKFLADAPCLARRSFNEGGQIQPRFCSNNGQANEIHNAFYSLFYILENFSHRGSLLVCQQPCGHSAGCVCEKTDGENHSFMTYLTLIHFHTRLFLEVGGKM